MFILFVIREHRIYREIESDLHTNMYVYIYIYTLYIHTHIYIYGQLVSYLAKLKSAGNPPKSRSSYFMVHPTD